MRSMQNPMSLRSRCVHRLWQSVLLVLGAGVLRMTLLRCPKFLRCLTADAGNFDRGHSLTSLPLPLAALGSLPTTSLRTGLGMTRKFFRLSVIAKPVRTLAVAIRSPRPLCRGITDSHDQSADWSRNDTQVLSASVIASRCEHRLPRTESLHRPSADPPPFRQGRLSFPLLFRSFTVRLHSATVWINTKN